MTMGVEMRALGGTFRVLLSDGRSSVVGLEGAWRGSWATDECRRSVSYCGGQRQINCWVRAQLTISARTRGSFLYASSYDSEAPPPNTASTSSRAHSCASGKVAR